MTLVLARPTYRVAWIPGAHWASKHNPSCPKAFNRPQHWRTQQALSSGWPWASPLSTDSPRLRAPSAAPGPDLCSQIASTHGCIICPCHPSPHLLFLIFLLEIFLFVHMYVVPLLKCKCQKGRGLDIFYPMGPRAGPDMDSPHVLAEQGNVQPCWWGKTDYVTVQPHRGVCGTVTGYGMVGKGNHQMMLSGENVTKYEHDYFLYKKKESIYCIGERLNVKNRCLRMEESPGTSFPFCVSSQYFLNFPQ